MSGRRGTPAATIGNDKLTLELNDEEAEFLFSPGAEDRMARQNAAVEAAAPLLMKCHTDMQRGRMTTAHEAYLKALRIVREALPADSLAKLRAASCALPTASSWTPATTALRAPRRCVAAACSAAGASGRLALSAFEHLACCAAARLLRDAAAEPPGCAAPDTRPRRGARRGCAVCTGYGGDAYRSAGAGGAPHAHGAECGIRAQLLPKRFSVSRRSWVNPQLMAVASAPGSEFLHGLDEAKREAQETQPGHWNWWH